MTFKWREKNQVNALDLYQQKGYKMKQQTLRENLLYQRKLKGYTQDELSENMIAINIDAILFFITKSS